MQYNTFCENQPRFAAKNAINHRISAALTAGSRPSPGSKCIQLSSSEYLARPSRRSLTHEMPPYLPKHMRIGLAFAPQDVPPLFAEHQ